MANRYRAVCGGCQGTHWSDEACPRSPALADASRQAAADVSRLYDLGGRSAAPEPWRPRVGEPCQTRDGRKARVICDDGKGDISVWALVERGGEEIAYGYSRNGHYNPGFAHSNDLIPIPAKPTTITLPRNGAGIHSDAKFEFARRWETMRNNHGIDESFAAAWDAMVQKLESMA